MTTRLDLKGTLAKMPMMQGRRPESTETERKATGAFVTLAPYRDGNIYSAKFSGEAAWERHPNGDELVQDRRRRLHDAFDDRAGARKSSGRRRHDCRGAADTWHRFSAPDGVSIITATPRPTEHLTVDVADPRTLSDSQRAANSSEEDALRCISTDDSAS